MQGAGTGSKGTVKATRQCPHGLEMSPPSSEPPESLTNLNRGHGPQFQGSQSHPRLGTVALPQLEPAVPGLCHLHGVCKALGATKSWAGGQEEAPGHRQMALPWSRWHKRTHQHCEADPKDNPSQWGCGAIGGFFPIFPPSGARGGGGTKMLGLIENTGIHGKIFPFSPLTRKQKKGWILVF